ncbi:MAG: hypothetical protein M3Q79_01965 [bacterium]|nr:hypothetical protein [bacterium]
MNKLKLMVGATLVLATSTLAVNFTSGRVGAIVIEDTDKVTICHRTNSVKNPYVKITVDASAVDGEGNNDHTQHTGPVATSEEVAQALKNDKTKWGDIIPSEEDGGVGDGLNWGTDGQAVFNNNCGNGENMITEVVPAAVTFKNPTCEAKGSYTVPATPNVMYSVNGSVVAAGTYEVANGSTVTVTAEAGDDYFIADGTADSWTNTFTAPTNCSTGQVLTTTTTQVTQKPQGAVDAGVGGTTKSVTAVAGFVTSLAVISFALLKRRSLLN